jgi:hypothetical protein
MRRVMMMAAVGVVLLSGCVHAPKEQASVRDGRTWYGEDRAKAELECPDGPLTLAGNRTKLTFKGRCTDVRITGDRNDISIEIVPAGRIEIAGNHNDVTWRQVGEGPMPELVNSGKSNDFHRR